MEFLINFSRLARPLSNVKNIALVLLTFYFSKSEFNLRLFLGSLISLSLVCSAFYAYNTISDFDLDRNNENKKHYSKAIHYFGEKKSFVIFITFLITGLFIGYFINLYFFVFLLLLALTNFLYSSKYTRFKEKFILDVFFGASLTFLFRFLAFWFVFSQSFPPLLILVGLISAKSGGYLLYKELDYLYLVKANIKNSITVLRKKTKIIISILLWTISFFSFIFLCLNAKYFQIEYLGKLPINFLFLIPFMILPLIIMYLLVLNKIKVQIKYLRIIGFCYWILVIIIIWSLLLYYNYEPVFKNHTQL